MKKKILTLAAVVTLTGVGFGQNTFPTSGNVGIGVYNPTYKLDIGSLNSYDGIRLDSKLLIRNSAEGSNHMVVENTTEDGSLYVRSQNAHVIINDTNNSQNVGIGTSNPLYKLETKGDICANGGWLRVVGNRGLYFQSYGGGFHMMDKDWIRTFGSKNFYHNTGIMRTDGTFQVGPEGERMIVKADGSIGIGTQNPDEKLTVKGKIHAEEVRVDLSVPADYVFEKYYTGKSNLKTDYTMPTLEEVEAFTKAHNHLPDVPSAKEIQKEGLHLKEMTNLLLQKVEELTLYTIEQQKQLKAQQKEIELLKEKVQNQ